MSAAEKNIKFAIVVCNASRKLYCICVSLHAAVLKQGAKSTRVQAKFCFRSTSSRAAVNFFWSYTTLLITASVIINSQ